MNLSEINDILTRIKDVKVAICGDYALDIYWILDKQGGEYSEETALMSQAVKRQYSSLGAAANVAHNLIAFEPAHVRAIGVIGDDYNGRDMTDKLVALGVDVSGLIVQPDQFDTIAFVKRYQDGQEQPRIDFGFRNQRSPETDQAILRALEKALVECDVVIFNQQVPGSITNPEFIDEANRLFASYDDKIVFLDARHYGDQFRHVYRKVNELEAARLNGVSLGHQEELSLDDARLHASQLREQMGKDVFLTRGSKGLIVVDADGCHTVPGIRLSGKIDTVGAGDAVIAALALSVAGGASAVEGAAFANLAAAVTVKKLFCTGTASGPEIAALAADADYVYSPELAEDIRAAQYLDAPDIEICEPNFKVLPGQVKHVVFDHDGTISTLREGWEAVMIPVMMQSILGPKYGQVDKAVFEEVQARVQRYIDESTGIQTIVQMEDLVEMVREYGYTPLGQIADKFEYKRRYNDALMAMVNERLQRIDQQELKNEDFIIKGVLDFLDRLAREGAVLYLASGTDHEDVVNEATQLGYAHYFQDRIYGALGDVQKFSKKKLIARILEEHQLEGRELMVIGDGPVEIRECRKRGGVAVGIASDEIRRYGLNSVKRTRLIKAGAHFILPDFCQADAFLDVIMEKGLNDVPEKTMQTMARVSEA